MQNINSSNKEKPQLSEAQERLFALLTKYADNGLDTPTHKAIREQIRIDGNLIKPTIALWKSQYEDQKTARLVATSEAALSKEFLEEGEIQLKVILSSFMTGFRKRASEEYAATLDKLVSDHRKLTESLRAELAAAQDDVTVARSEVEAARANAKAEIEAARANARAEIDAERAKAQQAVDEAKNETAVANDRNSRLSERAEIARAEREKAETELKYERELRLSAEGVCTSLREQVSLLTKQLRVADAEKDSLNQQVGNLAAQLEELRNRLPD